MKQLALLVLLFVLTAVAAQAQTYPITGTVIDNQGNVVAGTTVIVLSGTLATVNTTTQPGSPLATIYSDPAGTHVINQNTNPVQTDGHGNFVTYGAAGLYVVQAYLRSGQQYVWPVSIGGSGVGCISVNGSGCGTNINSTSSVTVSVSGSNITMTATGSGGGCTLPGNNLGLLSEHPAGTCYDSLDATWDDGASKQNLQFGDGTNVITSSELSFLSGHGNHLTNSYETWIRGVTNTISADAINTGTFEGFWLDGTNLKVSATGIGAGGSANSLFALGFGSTVGFPTFSQADTANLFNVMCLMSGCNATTVTGAAGDISAVNGGSMSESLFVGIGWTASANGSGSNTSSIYAIGEHSSGSAAAMFSSASGSNTSDVFAFGEAIRATSTGANSSLFGDEQLGFTLTLSSSGGGVFSSAYQLGDTDTISSTNSSAMTETYEIGDNLTITNCSHVFLIGENGSCSGLSGIIGLGFSSTPQEQITSSGVTFSVPITVPTNSFALNFLVNPATTQMNICGVSGVWAGCVPGISGRTVSGTSDTIVQGDLLSRVTYTSSSATAVSVTSAASLSSHFAFTVVNTGAGTVTLTPTAGQIGNPLASSMTVGPGFWCALDSWDSTNYYPVCGPNTPSGGGSGTVTSFSAGNLSPLFTTSVATATTTPALSFSLSTQSANTVFAGPTTGSAAAPTFRALVNADLPAGAGPQGVKVVTSSYTLGASDSGNILIVADCSSACTITLPATQPSTTYSAKVMSVGSTVATIALGGSDTWNGSTNVPVLNSFRILGVNADTTTATNYYGDAPLAAGTNVTFTAATNAFTIAASGGGGSTSLSSITAAGGSNTIANGNNPQTWNWAQTTNSQTAMAFGETTAATGTSDIEVSISTLAGSTAKPLSISDSLSGSQTLCALCITPTWNTTGVVDAGIFENVTNTASGTGSLLIDLQVGGLSEIKADKAGNVTAGLDFIAGTSTLSSGNLTAITSLVIDANSGNLLLESPSAGGNVTVQGGNSATATAGGNIFLEPGTNASTGSQGITQLDQSYTKTGTVAANELLCITTTGYQVQACPTGTAPWIGFGTGTGTPQNVISTGIVQSAPFDTSTVTVGDVACESTSTAGDVHDNGTAPCLTPVPYVGVIVKGGSSSVGDVQIGASPPPVIQVLQSTSNCTVTGTTPGNCSGMSFAAQANTAYRGMCFLYGTTSAGSTISQALWTTPASPTTSIWVAASGSSTATVAMTSAISFSNSTTSAASEFFFSFVNGATAGTVQLQIKDNTSGDTATLTAGSYCEVF